jgi:hypothetical protein
MCVQHSTRVFPLPNTQNYHTKISAIQPVSIQPHSPFLRPGIRGDVCERVTWPRASLPSSADIHLNARDNSYDRRMCL